ncbi:hypothetical protein DFH06DRAFT_1298415 [Mycena polygramma]|nr:hypothetical protein DFH06DRAFT_1298415 [Mycena polygramma]
MEGYKDSRLWRTWRMRAACYFQRFEEGTVNSNGVRLCTDLQRGGCKQIHQVESRTSFGPHILGEALSAMQNGVRRRREPTPQGATRKDPKDSGIGMTRSDASKSRPAAGAMVGEHGAPPLRQPRLGGPRATGAELQSKALHEGSKRERAFNFEMWAGQSQASVRRLYAVLPSRPVCVHAYGRSSGAGFWLCGFLLGIHPRRSKLIPFYTSIRNFRHIQSESHGEERLDEEEEAFYVRPYCPFTRG